MMFCMAGQENMKFNIEDRLIQVTTWTDLTVYETLPT
jgi:hypothetical protein